MKSKGEIPDGSAADTGDDLVVCSFFLFMTLVGGIEFVFHREEERKEER